MIFGGVESENRNNRPRRFFVIEAGDICFSALSHMQDEVDGFHDKISILSGLE